MKRQEAIAKIKSAYENGELGFQKGATDCRYYDSKTDSHCAVGVLIGKDDDLMNDSNNIDFPFLGSREDTILNAMVDVNKHDLHGLTRDELDMLQSKHDNIINSSGKTRDGYITSFKDYLYSLI